MTDSADRINVQVLRLLADQGALSTNQVFAQLTRGHRHSALMALLSHEREGRVTRLGRGTRTGRCGPAPILWGITGAGQAWLDHLPDPPRRTVRQTATSSANFVQANASRSAAAADRDAEVAQVMLDDWPDDWPDSYRRVAEARAAHPDWTWAQIGGHLGLSKDAAVSHWQRLAGPATGRDRFLRSARGKR